MDSAVNMPKINLLTARFRSIHSEVGEQSSASGGTLHISVQTKLEKDGDPNKAMGQVSFSVVAFPKGADVKDKKSFAFKVDVSVEGIFEWEKGKEPNLEDDATEYSLLQSLYIMAANEIVALAHKLGFPGVILPLDLRQNKSLAEKPIKKRSPRKAVGSGVTKK